MGVGPLRVAAPLCLVHCLPLLSLYLIPCPVSTHKVGVRSCFISLSVAPPPSCSHAHQSMPTHAHVYSVHQHRRIHRTMLLPPLPPSLPSPPSSLLPLLPLSSLPFSSPSPLLPSPYTIQCASWSSRSNQSWTVSHMTSQPREDSSLEWLWRRPSSSVSVALPSPPEHDRLTAGLSG